MKIYSGKDKLGKYFRCDNKKFYYKTQEAKKEAYILAIRYRYIRKHLTVKFA